MKSWRIKNLLLSAAAITLGGLLYLIFRDRSYVTVLLGNRDWLISVRHSMQPLSCEVVKYYIPDFLWAFSLACALRAVHGVGVQATVVCGMGAFLCGLIWELLQYAQIVSGTGDMLDVVMYLIAGLICILLNLKERRK